MLRLANKSQDSAEAKNLSSLWLGRVTIKMYRITTCCENYRCWWPKPGSLYRKNWSLILNFFCKRDKNDCERQLISEEQHCYKFLLIQQNHFFILNVNLTINDVEIIACKLELFKHNNWFHKSRDQRRKGEINNLTSAIVSAPWTDKITLQANMHSCL